MSDLAGLAERYANITGRIRELAAPERKVTLLAVTKTQPVEAIDALYQLGHRDFGENYVQELVEKATKLGAMGCTGIRWHFIGHLQTNKVKALIPFVHSVHSVDSEKLAIELSKRWIQTHGTGAPPLPVFLEVNIDAEESKAGALPEQVPTLASRMAAIPGLALQGLMAIPEASPSREKTSATFARLRALEAQSRPHTRGQLSMGMSSDYELAIPQGATHVRVGSALLKRGSTLL